jgi:DNA-binding HxlR family transcriptional regulator
METHANDGRATAGCPIERALLILDGKWSTLIIRELLTGPKRFGELRAALGIGSPKTLTERLRILEHQGVLTRTVHAEVPPRVVYELTDRGRSFRSVLAAMAEWGDADLDLHGHIAGH